MKWICACGVENGEKRNKCAGCGWTKGQSDAYKENPTPQPSSQGDIPNQPEKKRRGISLGSILGLLIVAAIVGGIGKGIGKNTYKNLERQKLDKAIEEQILQNVKNMNNQLPIMVDPDTRIDAVTCSGKSLFYKCTLVHLSDKEIDKETFKREATKRILKNQCDNPDVRKALKAGVENNYMYYSNDGSLICTIRINKNICDLYEG